jgi:hypothetical protein
MIFKINSERDFDEYILSHGSKAPMAKSELQYVKHPTQAQTRSHPTPSAAVSGNRRASMQLQSQPPPSVSMPQPDANPLSPQGPSSFEPLKEPSFGTTSQPPPSSLQTQPQQSQTPHFNNSPYTPVAPNPPYPQSDYPRGPVGQATAQQTSGVLYNNSQPPVNPVFGVTLEDLFHRDGSPVPMVVYQCIQAVDLYGLEVEGIYRIPGTSSHIQQMKALFDSGT